MSDSNEILTYEIFTELSKLPMKEAIEKIDNILPKDDSTGIFSICAYGWDDGSKEGGQFFENIEISKEFDNHFDMDISKVKANSCVEALSYISGVIGEYGEIGYEDPDFSFSFNSFNYNGKINKILSEAVDELIKDMENPEKHKVLALVTYSLKQIEKFNNILQDAFLSKIKWYLYHFIFLTFYDGFWMSSKYVFIPLDVWFISAL